MELKEPKVKAKAKGEYQTTELGVIPADWQVKKLGEIGDCLIGLTYTPGQVREHGTLVLRSSNVANGKLVFGDNVFVEADIPERIMVQENDILICVRNGSRDLIGKSALVDRRAKGMTFGAFMAVFRTPAASFVFNQFQSEVIKRQIHEHLGATINQITNKSLKSFQIPYTEDPAEQHAIATALSDVDGLIAGLEGQLAKKRALKQGAMQQLLSGQKRLPGFTGEWGVKRFDELARPRKERVDPRRSGPQMFCVELEHIEQGTGRICGHTIAGEGSSQKTDFREGDVLFGKLRAYLRKYWLANRAGVCSTEVWALVANPTTMIPAYLVQIVTLNSFIELASTAYGTHMPRSDWKVVKEFELRVPEPEEQTAIATVLSDMDAELAALEAKLGKTRLLKQGMIGVLLTGRTRLI